MNRRSIACLALGASLCVAGGEAPRASKAPYSAIVTFGTSLSDPGNAFFQRGGIATPPDFGLNAFFFPSAAYARGGHHFTNGATWVEQLGQDLGLARSVKSAWKPGQNHAANYAVATARASLTDEGSLNDQVDEFLADTGGVAPSDALYVIEMGTNDIRDALAAVAAGGSATPVITAAVGSIASNMTRLYAAGARNFLVWRAPDVSIAPTVRALDAIFPLASFVAHQISDGFNAALDATLAGTTPLLPGISVKRLNADTILAEILADPAAFGLTNVTTPCLTPDVPPFTCQTPNEYLFWDGLHPTKAVHAIIAERAALALGL